MIFSPTNYATNKTTGDQVEQMRQQIQQQIDPYMHYWWRIRQNVGSYSLRLVPSKQIEGAYEEVTASNGNVYYKVNILECWSRSNGDENDGEYNDKRTIQVASNISLGSNGSISLVSPTSYSISGEDFYSQKTTYNSILAGKYVKGLSISPQRIYKVGTSPDIQTWNASITVSGENTHYTDYYIYASKVQVAVADYTETISDFSYVSNEDENFYPHSGTQDGVEYQFLGKIFDVAVKAEPYTIKTINITSANWNDRKYSIDIPCSRYMLWAGDGSNGGLNKFGSWLLIDNQKVYGVAKAYNSSNYDYYPTFYTGHTPGTSSGNAVYISQSIGLTITDTGIQLWYPSSASATPTGVLAYMPL